MNWKWWFLVVLLEIFWVGLAFADKKEKEWPPMPALDSLPGDTTGAITIKDSALIPTFGIYPVSGWAKASYVDTNTFEQYGLILFFDPWDEGIRDFVGIFCELRDKIENDWGFRLFLIACRMSVVSCKPYEEGKFRGWDCGVLLTSDFNETNSLRKAMVSLRWAYPVYRLKQPLWFDVPIYKEPPTFILVSAKEHYSVGYMTLPGLTGKMSRIERMLIKTYLRLAFPAGKKYLKKWKYDSLGKAEKK